MHCNRRIGQLVARKLDVSLQFSRRELEVLKWMGYSKSNTDIGTILGILFTTADTYVRRFFDKLGVYDRISTVIKGARLGYIRY
jgi:DNA-binding NarL/FixJ family response regulator